MHARIRQGLVLVLVGLIGLLSGMPGPTPTGLAAEHRARHAGRGTRAGHPHGPRPAPGLHVGYRCPYHHGYRYYGVWSLYPGWRYYVGPYGTLFHLDSAVIFPPIAADASTLFGPRPILNQMGVGPGLQPQPGPILPGPGPQSDLVLVRPDGEAQHADLPDVAAVVRARARARKFIEQGDNHFRAGKYPSAIQKYRAAVAAEPTFAESWFRRGLAELGLARYPNAIASIERGLELDPDWPEAPFRLSAIYADAETIANHRQTLAAAALDDPEDGGLFFLLGLHLHFDGQQERAQPFFEKAVALGDHLEAIVPFLAKAEGLEILPAAEAPRPSGREF